MVIGPGLPLIFLATSIPVTAISYRLGNICAPVHSTALYTWFMWLLALAIMSSMIQISVITYCIWIYARRVRSLDRHRHHSSASTTALYPPDLRIVAWKKVRDVLAKQWRHLTTAFMVANLTIFFGLVFIQDTTPSQESLVPEHDPSMRLDWITCLTQSRGDKTACLPLASGLAITESRAVATFVLASVSSLNNPTIEQVLS